MTVVAASSVGLNAAVIAKTKAWPKGRWSSPVSVDRGSLGHGSGDWCSGARRRTDPPGRRSSPNDGDEPQEGDSGERGEGDADERDPAGVLPYVEVADLRRRAVACGMVAQEENRDDEEGGEGEAGDSGGAR